MLKMQSMIVGFLAASFLVIIPAWRAGAIAAEMDGLGRPDRDDLLAYARDTWRSVAEMGDASDLPADGLRHVDGTWKPSSKTSPTDIACYLWSTLAAERLAIIGNDEAVRRIGKTLDSLSRVERVHGFFYDRLDAATGAHLKESPLDGAKTVPIASSVDNGWLAAGLIVVRNSYPSLRERAEDLLKPMDFAFFYVPYDAADPKTHPGHVRGPYRADQHDFGGFHRLINTEQRIFSYIGIARGQLPPEHYFRLERTLHRGEQRQRQIPAGETRTYLGIPVFEGHYVCHGKWIVPSWGGSMFEALMVTLFVPEERWAPRSWGVNHPLYVQTQIEFGLKEAGYGYWGFSPACNPTGGYHTYGIEALASDPSGYPSNDENIPAEPGRATPKRRFDNGIVTPHASFLALRFAPREAMENLRKLKETFPIYGDHGFMDSVNVSTGVVANAVLILDQGMIMAAIANALADDAMRRAFVDSQTERILRPLIAVEEFTAGLAVPNIPSRPSASSKAP